MELSILNKKGKDTGRKVKLSQSVFGIEPNAFGALGAVVNFAVAFAVSAVTRPPPEAVKEMVANIRVP